MRLSDTAIKRPVTTIMLVLAILLLGFVSYTKIPLDMLPTLDLPYAAVVVKYDGAGPQEIENVVARPLEGVLSTVSTVKEIQSISSK